MTSGYAAYPNPTITEAICDIHFRLPQEKGWRPSFPGELFKHIQNEYPEMEPVLEMGLQFEFGPLGTGTKYEPPRAASQSEIESKELPQSTAQSPKSHALIQLLKSWREGDEQEQRSTWEYLKQALDEDRLSERKLFP